MKKNTVFVILGVILVVCLFLVTIFLPQKEEKESRYKANLLNVNYDIEGNEGEISYGDSNPVIAMKIKNYGSIIMELYPDIAPNTVANFVSLVKDGFYDDNTFHRLVPGFVLQGGDPDGKGTGGPGYSIKGEFNSNGYNNDLVHDKWIVSMARSSSPDSAGSQFFICLEKASNLDGEYASFGKIIEGFKNIEAIVENENVVNKQTGQLEKNLIIEKAIVDLKGNSIPEVEKVNN